MNKFLKDFKDRGYFYQCTSEDELSNLLNKEKIKAYIGFDCTAESLHVGSLLQIMCLRLLQKNGHRPIVLLGGGTTRIGDPSGKDKTRKILSEEEIEKNIQNIKNILKKYISQPVDIKKYVADPQAIWMRTYLRKFILNDFNFYFFKENKLFNSSKVKKAYFNFLNGSNKIPSYTFFTIFCLNRFMKLFKIKVD